MKYLNKTKVNQKIKSELGDIRISISASFYNGLDEIIEAIITMASKLAKEKQVSRIKFDTLFTEKKEKKQIIPIY